MALHGTCAICHAAMFLLIVATLVAGRGFLVLKSRGGQEPAATVRCASPCQRKEFQFRPCSALWAWHATGCITGRGIRWNGGNQCFVLGFMVLDMGPGLRES